MEKKKHHDEMLKRTSGGTKLGQDEALIKEVESLNLDVPQEIMQRIESDVAQSEKQAKISMDGLTKALMSTRAECGFLSFLLASERFSVSPLISLALTLPHGL